ncbi:MAG TPA: SoxR reducing system RseC family protein [Clostridiales bacterium]|nr:SoxR reducing system RseC family protein [Clostridiales bacterium]
MNHVGQVLQLYEDNRAKVLIRRHTACSECGACKHGKQDMNMEIIAVNNANAKIGDVVEISMQTHNVLTAALLVYGIPLLMLIIGVVAGYAILQKMGFTAKLELYSVLIGLVLLILTYIALKIYENVLKKDARYTPVISRIIDEE